MEALLRFASSRLGMTPQQLAGTVQSGGLKALQQKLPPQKADQLNALIGDPKQAENWLRDPKTAGMLQNFLKKQGQ